MEYQNYTDQDHVRIRQDLSQPPPVHNQNSAHAHANNAHAYAHAHPHAQAAPSSSSYLARNDSSSQPQDSSYFSSSNAAAFAFAQNQQQQNQHQFASSSNSATAPNGSYALSPQQHPQSPDPPQPASPTTQKSKSRSFSFHSDKKANAAAATASSHNRRASTKSGDERHGAADHDKRLQSKADPTLAMSEAEPSVIASMGGDSVLGSLRDVQHKDAYGNPIADPDLSNPTRNRWERPLDTIRSFEAAIDDGYTRRASMIRSSSGTINRSNNRRSSYFAAPPQSKFRPDSYYNARPTSFRPEQTQFTLATPGTARSSIYGYESHRQFDEQANVYGPTEGRPRQSRMMSEPYYTVSARDQQAFFQQQQHPHAHPQDVYRLAHKDRSYETVTSAEGSRNSDQVGYQTDPTSSDNSSIERRRSPAKRAHPNGMAPPPPAHAGAPARYSQQQPQPPMQAQQPSQKGAIPRKEAPSVLKRTGSKAQGAAQQAPRPAAPEKKKSWLVRRFSKSS